MSNKQNRNKKRTRRTIKPVAALYEGGNPTVLVKDENAKGCLRPLTQDEKDLTYPGLDKNSPEKVAKRLGLYEDDVVRLDDGQGRKQAKSNKNQKRVRQFLALPSAFSNPKAGFAVLFAALLAQFSAFVPRAASTIRAIYFEDESDLNAACVLLSGINGSVQRKGEGYKMTRPVCLRGTKDSALSTGFSTSPYAYLGGKVNILGKKREFWLPLWRCAVAVTSDLPEAIRALVDGWPTVIPLLFGLKRAKNSTAIAFNDNLEVETKTLQKAEKGYPIISAIFNKFRLSVFERPKRGREIFEAVDGWLEVLHVKGGGTVQPSDEQKFYAAGLCIYGTFLDYLVDKKWLSNEMKVEIIEAEACPDHIHMLVSIPPYMSVAQFMGTLKSKSALMIFDRHANLKYKYGNRNFWCRGYYVDTVGKNEKMIKDYIKNQLEEDYTSDQKNAKRIHRPVYG